MSDDKLVYNIKRLTQYKFKVELPLNRNEVYETISHYTEYEPTNYILPKYFTTSTKKFTGKVNLISFVLAPMISYGNSFLPLLFGEIDEGENVTTINIHTAIPRTINGLVIIFDLFCLFFLTIGLLILIFDDIAFEDSAFIILFPIMFTVLNRLSLYISAQKTIKTFKKMFDDSEYHG